MKKSFILVLAALLVLSSVFAACSSKKEEEAATESTTAADLNDVDTEYGFETEAVTDESGEAVTDESGNAVTTEVAVLYKTDKDGNTYAQKIDAEGKEVTNKDGKAVTVKTTYKATTAKAAESTTSGANDSTTASGNSATADSEKENSGAETPATTTQKAETTATTKKNVDLTKSETTSSFIGIEVVPGTNATGEEVSFAEEDQEIIASMLEVPYLYLANYENIDGVPVKTAVYTAVWMANRQSNGEATTGDKYIYTANPIILNLFKFYGNTVVNFKSKCNSVEETPIKYNSSTDSFAISEFPEPQQTVTITKIEDLGNNNFYKVTGNVENAGDIKKVVAIVQKNRLEPTLGFSIKALRWSK